MTTTATPPTMHEETASAERAAHAILGLVAMLPGQFGRLRTARLVAGFTIPLDGEELVRTVAPFTAVVTGWPLREMIALVDAMIDGGLIAQTGGPRPTLVLTRAGHRALDALDAAPVDPIDTQP